MKTIPQDQRRSDVRKPPAVWGGIEGTVNRVGDTYHDQNERSGHARRISDLDLVAGLGIEALRYPVLWERTAPDGLDRADWSWTDERLGRLRTLGVRPIAGLVHHGSGPRDTSLLDPCFPKKLAGYARAVAERYPWIDAYTPVNEPLTTARFSGLYGHWYPHGRDGHTFLRTLLIECRAVVLAMRAIREVNSDAQLIQTDDLGKTYGTAPMAAQVELDNERRWLGFDLLCGHVDQAHPLWEHMRREGIPERELLWFRDNPCPPDVLGINYYVTSERFLDHRSERYPEYRHTRGPGLWPDGNKGRVFADVEAARIYADGPAGAGSLMREAWERYGLPLAVTEVQLACTREEQMRWLLETWNAAQALHHDGVDVRAVTAWALFGAFDWSNLVRHIWGDYEPGAFDLRSPQPRPTALAAMIRDLAAGCVPRHPVLDVPGWWRRQERFEFPPEPASRRGPAVSPSHTSTRKSTAPIMIVGSEGSLGNAFARLCALRGLPHCFVSAEDSDGADPASVGAALCRCKPYAVVNLLEHGISDPSVLAAACAQRRLPFLTFSSGAVFDGAKGAPYVEDDAVVPVSYRGKRLATAEARIREVHPAALIVRTGVRFDPWDEQDWVAQAIEALAAGQPVTVDGRATISLTYVPDLVHASLDLLIDDEQGVWHLTNPGAMTEEEFLCLAATGAGIDGALAIISPTPTAGVPSPPCHRALSSVRGLLLPPLPRSLAEYFRERPLPTAEKRPSAGSRHEDRPILCAAR